MLKVVVGVMMWVFLGVGRRHMKFRPTLFVEESVSCFDGGVTGGDEDV